MQQKLLPGAPNQGPLLYVYINGNKIKINSIISNIKILKNGKNIKTLLINNDYYLKRKDLIEFRCYKCGKTTKTIFSGKNKFLNMNFICRTCSTKQTLKNKYGVINISQLDSIKKKVKQTTLERYGNKNYRNVKQAKQTNLYRYGGTGWESKTVNNKIKKTMQDRYNGIGWGSEIISKKSNNTILEKYDCMNISQLDKIKEKKIETCLENHNVKYPMQSKEIKNKRKQTCLRKYGTEYVLQSEGIKNKIKQTMLNRYGVEYTNQVPEFHKKIMSSFGQSQKLKQLSENLHYQSIPELNFIQYCLDNNIDVWDGPSIPYYLDGKKHIYHIDFETDKWVVEIKSSHHWYHRDLESGVLGVKNMVAGKYADGIGKKFKFILDGEEI